MRAFDIIILPGVGSFKQAIKYLKNNNFDKEILNFLQLKNKGILGICLGMQLFFESSEEFGFTKGLGLIEGSVKEFDKTKFEHKLKVPHMGWNELFVQGNSKLFAGMNKEIYLYFVHSFHATCKKEFVIGKTFYGYDFVSAIEKDNIYGFQPHPEKSHENGLKILKNFINI